MTDPHDEDSVQVLINPKNNAVSLIDQMPKLVTTKARFGHERTSIRLTFE